jgi:hypothetical protein
LESQKFLALFWLLAHCPCGESQKSSPRMGREVEATAREGCRGLGGTVSGTVSGTVTAY